MSTLPERIDSTRRFLETWGGSDDKKGSAYALLGEAKAEIERLKTETSRLIEGMRYWSYCMSEGMRATCPEKCEELMDFLISCQIAPYYVRTQKVVRRDTGSTQ